MFTGIVEELGEVLGRQFNKESAVLFIKGRKVLEDLKVGDSIAVNGVCLTATKVTGEAFYADVMPETMRRSNLGNLKVGEKVNLERALAAGGRLGGHFVSGHIDGTGSLLWEEKEGNALVKCFSAPPEVLRYVVVKGSIAVDGISLTVVDFDDNSFKVSLIPHTLEQTSLFYRKRGDRVNLEADMLGKYLEKLLIPLFRENLSLPQLERAREKTPQGLTMSFLAEKGFV